MTDEPQEPDAEQEAPKVGRPTDYRPEFVQKAADACFNGATLYEVAELLGVCRTTLNQWRAKYPEFATALTLGGDNQCTARIRASLFERGIGYSHPDVHIAAGKEGVTITPITRHYPPDYQSMSLWLRNRAPGEWKDKQEVEHTASQDLLDVMKAARERAGLAPPDKSKG